MKQSRKQTNKQTVWELDSYIHASDQEASDLAPRFLSIYYPAYANAATVVTFGL